MTITETLSRLPKEILVSEDEQNGKISFSLEKFAFSKDKKMRAGQEDALQGVLRSFKNKYDYEFDQLVFRGLGPKMRNWDPDLRRKNRYERNYHYFVLSRNYYKYSGVWDARKILDIYGSKIFVRLNQDEWKTMEYLTRNYFASRYENSFANRKFAESGYNIQVRFADVVSISFRDMF